MDGLNIGNTLSTPSPKDIFLTVKDELRPLFFFPMQTPSNACILSRVPSRTFTLTLTVSPGWNCGIFFPFTNDFIWSFSNCSIMFMVASHRVLILYFLLVLLFL